MTCTWYYHGGCLEQLIISWCLYNIMFRLSYVNTLKGHEGPVTVIATSPTLGDIASVCSSISRSSKPSTTSNISKPPSSPLGRRFFWTHFNPYNGACYCSYTYVQFVCIYPAFGMNCSGPSERSVLMYHFHIQSPYYIQSPQKSRYSTWEYGRSTVNWWRESLVRFRSSAYSTPLLPRVSTSMSWPVVLPMEL